jgi:hypothetical protein
MSRVTAFNKHGIMVGDLRAQTKRTYTLASTGVIGQCDFDISTFDSHARLKFLEYGNFVLVRQDNLPDWLGIIYPPRGRRFGSVSVRAYQIENLLYWRTTPTQKYTGSAGSIFQQILTWTNSARNNEKLIKPGIIYSDGNSREETTGNDALSHLVSVAKRSGQDFDIKYSIDSGKLVLTGNWYEMKGIDTGKYFREGHNIEAKDNVMEDNGEIYNDLTGISDASTPNTRMTSNLYSDASIDRYGLYQKNIVYSGVTQQATLNSNVLEQLIRTMEPEKVFDLVALNVGDTYQYLDTGNIWNVDMNYVWLQDEKFVTQPKVRILGMEVDDAIEKVRIISEIAYVS